MTMIELMISVVILTVCCGMLTSTLSATNLHRATNRERALAAEAARGVVEDMHNWRFGAVFTTYNDDPSDDPEGVGSAPGKHFAVEGLSPASDDADGFVGEVFLPTTRSPLLESVEDEQLCMPRDLNGDMVIDGEDHTQDHIILPVRVVVRWKARSGVRSLELHTMLADMEKFE
jgi:type II secretory pathway pseudopilin PulG